MSERSDIDELRLRGALKGNRPGAERDLPLAYAEQGQFSGPRRDLAEAAAMFVKDGVGAVSVALGVPPAIAAARIVNELHLVIGVMARWERVGFLIEPLGLPFSVCVEDFEAEFVRRHMHSLLDSECRVPGAESR